MKKKRNVRKLMDKNISVGLAGSVLLASCTSNGVPPPNDVLQVGMKQVKRVQGYPVDDDFFYHSTVIELTNEDEQLMELFSNLAQDILTDPDMASLFVNDPEGYLAQFGYEYTGRIDAGLLQMATAFADDEIRNAIERGDIDDFIGLCSSRGLLSLPSGLNEANIKEQIKLFSNNVFVDGDPAMSIVTILLVIALVVVFVAVIGPDCDDPPCYGFSYDRLSPLTLWAYDSPNTYIPSEEWVSAQYEMIEGFLNVYDERFVMDEEYHNTLENIIKSTLIQNL